MGGVGRVLKKSPVALAVYAVLIGLTVFAFVQDSRRVRSGAGQALPRGQHPQLPDAASLDRTTAVVQEGQRDRPEDAGRARRGGLPGPLDQRLQVNSTNAAAIFTAAGGLRRSARSKTLCRPNAIAASLNKQFAAIPDATIQVFPPPPVFGLGNIGGFRMQIEDRGGLGADRPEQGGAGHRDGQRLRTRAWRACSPPTASARPRSTPTWTAKRPAPRASPCTDLYETMQVYLGSLYVNDFNRFGRTYQVNVQGDQRFRLEPEDISRLQTRNAAGQMIPLGAFVTTHETTGPERTAHYNGYLTAEINGGPAPGFSSGQAQQAIEEIAQEEPAPGHGLSNGPT